MEAPPRTALKKEDFEKLITSNGEIYDKDGKKIDPIPKLEEFEEEKFFDTSVPDAAGTEKKTNSSGNIVFDTLNGVVTDYEGKIEANKANSVKFPLENGLSEELITAGVLQFCKENTRAAAGGADETQVEDKDKAKAVDETPVETQVETQVTGDAVVEPPPKDSAAAGGRRRTKRKGHKGRKGSHNKNQQQQSSQNGGRRSCKNRRKQSRRRKH